MLVMWNPSNGNDEAVQTLRSRLAERGDVELHETTSGAEATDLVRRAVQRGVDLVVAAGGDGTVHAVVEGLAPDPRETRLAILPLGTGNDFCRTLAIPLDPLDAADLLDQGVVRGVDMLQAESDAWSTWFLNMATGGSSGQVADATTGEIKQRWGPLAYVRGAAEKVTDLVAYDIQLQCDDAPWQTFRAINVLVGNGRTAAGGFDVSPRANPADGMLEAILLLEGTLVELAGTITQLLVDDYLDSDQVIYRRARRVELRFDPPLRFSIDGDLYDAVSSVTFRIKPQALSLVTPPQWPFTPID